MIEAIDIRKSFGEDEVLKGISAKFVSGETSLIIGKSGAGKSVFLKGLVGLFSIDGGEIYYNERRLSHMTDEERTTLRTEMGMVFQGNALFDSLSIEENVAFALNMFGDMSKSEIRDRANFCLERVDLKGVNKKFPAELSGGMQKRVAIARSICMQPKYLFCDEPNSGLDPQTAIVIDKLITEITQEYDITTVINSHDMNSVLEMGDYILYIKDGVKAWEGSKEDLLKTDDENINEFVYSSEIFKKIKKTM